MRRALAFTSATVVGGLITYIVPLAPLIGTQYGY